MQLALDLASYLLGGTMLLGLLLLGLLIKDVLFGGGFKEPHPPFERMPCAALEQGRRVLDQLKTAHRNADPALRRPLELHLRRLEDRVKHLEERTLSDQGAYYRAVSRRERNWQQWKALHQQVQRMQRSDRARTRHLLEETERAYRLIEREVRDEWQRNLARDKLLNDELREQGLLDADYVPRLLEQLNILPAPEAQSQGASEAYPSGAMPADGAHPESADPDSASDAKGEAGAAVAAAEPEAARIPKRGGIGALSYDRVLEIVGAVFFKGRSKPAPPAADVQTLSAPPAKAATGATAASGATAIAGKQPPAIAPAAPAEAPAGAEAQGASAAGALHQSDFAPPLRAGPGLRYQGATFELGALPKGILRDADLSMASFAGVNFNGRHRYLDCRFTGADLSGIVLQPQQRAHQFVRCDFEGANFAHSRLGYLLFHQCNLKRSTWAGARLERVRFVECQLEDAAWADSEWIETRIGTAPPGHAPVPTAPIADPRDQKAPDEPAAEAPQGAVPSAPATAEDRASAAAPIPEAGQPKL